MFHVLRSALFVLRIVVRRVILVMCLKKANVGVALMVVRHALRKVAVTPTSASVDSNLHRVPANSRAISGSRSAGPLNVRTVSCAVVIAGV